MNISFTADRRRLVDTVDLEHVLASLLQLRDNSGFSRSLDGEFWFASTRCVVIHSTALNENLNGKLVRLIYTHM